MSLFTEVLAAHALKFERPVRASYDGVAGQRLLLAFALIALALHPALRALIRSTGDSGPWAGTTLVLTLLLAFVLVLRLFVRIEGAAIGLHRWEAWTHRERLYLWTVVPPAAAAFAVVFRDHFARLAEIHGWVGLFALAVPTGILWGLVQELIYRGLLQTELARQLGGVAGVLLANLVFTFGPLHFEYFGFGSDAAPRWGMFAAIFGIGLFFGALYRRSGNLWIPALLHGLWPPNMS